MSDATALYWPAARLTEALEVLGRAAGFPVRRNAVPDAARTNPEADVAAAAAKVGLDTDRISAPCGEVAAMLRNVGPAVVQLPEGFIVVLKRSTGGLKIIRTDHEIATVPMSRIRRALIEPTATRFRPELTRLVDQTAGRSSRHDEIVDALLSDRVRSETIDIGWVIRPGTNAPFRIQLKTARVTRQLMLLGLAHLGQYSMMIAAWWLLGRTAMQGRLDTGVLVAWMLMLLTVAVLQLTALWLQGRVAITTGALLKQRLLAGACQLRSEEIRRDGAGQLLGRAIEADAVGSLALGGGLLALLAAIELAVAVPVLVLSVPIIAALLLIWLVVTAVLTFVYLKRRTAWVGERITLTHDLIERMVGHRTRLAQQPREAWHAGEDEAIARYLHASSVMDRSAVRLLAIVPRGWMIIGLSGLTPLFVSGGSAGRLAAGLGGMLLAFRALQRMTNGLWNLAGAWIAWQQTALIFRAADRAAMEAPPRACTSVTPGNGRVVLDATDLRFTHDGRSEPAIAGCTLSIRARDRVILQGPSGGGKSTLASLLAGLRAPASGLILLDGLDRQTLGLPAWRRRVVLVPQFHENHVVLGSVAFNVLMGVGWPPEPGDFERADHTLRQLGLGDTLDRMPSGLLQTIGETGWQLSHGERSRLYLARALLQKPEVLILDETFAQLDPENMHRALSVVSAENAAVLLIAHA